MPAISATRHEVSDRFEVLGFTVKTGSKPYFQVVWSRSGHAAGQKKAHSGDVLGQQP